MVLGSLFIQAFLVGLSGAVMPGPLLTYNFQLAYQQGFWAGPKLVLGHAVLEALLVLGLIGGLGAFVRHPVTRVVLGLLGGLMLAWMGCELLWKESRRGLRVFRETAAAGGPAGPAGTHAASLHPALAGLLISLTNPYWSLWWAVVGLAFITKAAVYGWAGLLAFYTGHILADLGWYSLVSLAVAKGRQFISEGIYRWLLIGCGAFLIVLAVSFGFDALKNIPELWDKAIDLFKLEHSAVTV